jgi:hypothetical protein
VLFALGNALMNDSWFSQTIDPSQTGSISLLFFKWLRENKIALISVLSFLKRGVEVINAIRARDIRLVPG